MRPRAAKCILFVDWGLEDLTLSLSPFERVVSAGIVWNYVVVVKDVESDDESVESKMRAAA